MYLPDALSGKIQAQLRRVADNIWDFVGIVRDTET